MLDLRFITLNQKLLLVGFVLIAAVSLSVLKDMGKNVSLLSIELPFQNKIVHFLGAGVFSGLATIFTKNGINIFGAKVSPLVIALLLLSIIEELTQLYRPNRGFSMDDIVANILGILFFAFLAQKMRYKKLILY